jgi:hypothetical protein
VSSTKEIPVVKEFMVGKNLARRTSGYQYGEIAVFEKKEDLQIYEHHPAHRKIVRKILPKLDHGVTMDFVPIGGAALANDHSSTATDSSEEKGDAKNTLFVHVHYFKFKPTASEEEITAVMKELAGLKKKIPVLKEILVGKNTSRNNHGFHYAQVSIFEKEEDLQVYNQHPEHQKLVRRVGPLMVGGLSMDFEPLSATGNQAATAKKVTVPAGATSENPKRRGKGPNPFADIDLSQEQITQVQDLHKSILPLRKEALESKDRRKLQAIQKKFQAALAKILSEEQMAEHQAAMVKIRDEARSKREMKKRKTTE